jgi:hypothetical protein
MKPSKNTWQYALLGFIIYLMGNPIVFEDDHIPQVQYDIETGNPQDNGSLNKAVLIQYFSW